MRMVVEVARGRATWKAKKEAKQKVPNMGERQQRNRKKNSRSPKEREREKEKGSEREVTYATAAHVLRRHSFNIILVLSNFPYVIAKMSTCGARGTLPEDRQKKNIVSSEM